MEGIEKSVTAASGSESKIPCEFCGNMYETTQGLQSHVRIQHFEMMCAACGETFPTVTELRNHKKIHRILYTCDICPYTSYYVKCLRSHILKHSEKTRYNCPICKQPFRRRGDLTMHMNRDH